MVNVSEKRYTSAYALWFEDEILYVEYLPTDVGITMKEANELFATIREMSGGVAHPVLSDITHLTSITGEAKKYYASPEHIPLFKRIAVVTKSPISATISNFFITFYKPPFPMKLFSNRKDALAWIHEHAAEDAGGGGAVGAPIGKSLSK